MDVGCVNLGVQLQTGSCDLNATKINGFIPVVIWKVWCLVNRSIGVAKRSRVDLPAGACFVVLLLGQWNPREAV